MWASNHVGGIIAALVVAALLGIFGVVLGWVPVFNSNDDSKLELVDASFSKESNEATTLDIKVRNVGEKIAYLKEANFRVEKTWELRSTTYPELVPVSGNYDVTLKPTGTPYTKTVKLSQGIKPGAVDRFSFTLVMNERARDYAGNVNYVFLVTLDLIYDGDDKVTSTPNLLFIRELPWEQSVSYFPYGVPGDEDASQDPYFEAVRAHNAQVVAEISVVDGTKSESLKKLIRYISKRD